MSPALKFQLMNDMFRAAWELKRVAVRNAHPDWDDEQIREKVKEYIMYSGG